MYTKWSVASVVFLLNTLSFIQISHQNILCVSWRPGKHAEWFPDFESFIVYIAALEEHGM